MWLFDFYKKENKQDSSSMVTKDEFSDEKEVSEIGKRINTKSNLSPIEKIYSFIGENFEDKGYNDALINSDSSYSNDNIKLLKYDLLIMLKESSQAYEQFLKDIDFHINSRKESGLIDTVKELETKKEKTMLDLSEVKSIKTDYDNNSGVVERIELSYMRGFRKGLASISGDIIKQQL